MALLPLHGGASVTRPQMTAPSGAPPEAWSKPTQIVAVLGNACGGSARGPAALRVVAAESGRLVEKVWKMGGETDNNLLLANELRN